MMMMMVVVGSYSMPGRKNKKKFFKISKMPTAGTCREARSCRRISTWEKIQVLKIRRKKGKKKKK
jgi:hypothetical protein